MGADKREKKKSEWCYGLECSKLLFALIPEDFDSHGGIQWKIYMNIDNQGSILFLCDPFSVHWVKANEKLVETSNNLTLALTDSFTTTERKSTIQVSGWAWKPQLLPK